MVKSSRFSGTVVENNFSKGLITEATGFNFPENACTETYNCIFETSGKVSRRKGFDYETGYHTTTVTRNDTYVTEFVWKAVGGDGNINFLVIQYSATLYFYDINDSDAICDSNKGFTVDLTDFSPSGAPGPRNAPCQYSTGNGYLFVTHPYLDPFYIVYDPDGDDISTHQVHLKIRDFEGVDDTLDVDERPNTLSQKHEYNLYNQGWYRDQVLLTPTTDDDDATFDNPVTKFNDAVSKYPSNADIWWVFKDSVGNFNPGDTAYIVDTGNTAAPKGHYILAAFNPNRYQYVPGADSSDIPSIDPGYYRPSASAFFAGRVFYAGVGAKTFSSKVYYSQIIERDEQIGFCYQQEDPTAENSSDLLPSDGGVLLIQEIGTVYKLFPMRDTLLIFADNGVWGISGSQGIGFKANDFSVQRLSSVGSVSPQSFVDVNGIPMWWNTDGIYTLNGDSTSGISVQSMTDKTIQKYFKDIESSSIKYVKGAYNPLTNVVQWLFRAAANDDIDTSQNFYRVLNFNTATGAFYPWSMSTNITVNGVVAIKKNVSVGDSIKFYYLSTSHLTGTDWKFILALCENDTNKDWSTAAEEDYFSYGISGYKVLGNGNNVFQSNYITVYIENIENSSLSIQGMWDYATTNNEKRWSIAQECYLFTEPADASITFRRLKIRGQGNALQFRFYSTGGQSFGLLGWSCVISGRTQP